MKEGPISELPITETGHRPSQFKKIYDDLPVFIVDENYGGLDEVLCTGRDKVENDFMPAYPNANLWYNTHQIQVASVQPGVTLVEGTATNERVVTYQTVEQTIVTNANLQKQLLSQYKRNFKNKSQEYSKFLQDKKSLITILFRQCDKATQTEIALADSYTEDRDKGKLLAFIERLRAICFSGDNGGLSYRPYKQVVAIKLLNIYTNNNPNDPHGFKEQVKIKFEATKAIVRRFPNGTAALTHLLSKAETPLDWDAYCALPEEGQLVWETRAEALNQSMIYLMASKNKIVKKDLCLAYSQGNYTAYPADIEAAARYLFTQYPNSKTSNQRKNKQRKGDDPKSEDKDNTTGGNAGAHVEDTTTTNEDTTAPSGGANLDAHVSETKQATSHPTRTVEEILGAHPIVLARSLRVV